MARREAREERAWRGREARMHYRTAMLAEQVALFSVEEASDRYGGRFPDGGLKWYKNVR